MSQHIHRCFRMVIFGVVISRWPVVSIDCGESRLTVSTDDTCLILSPLVPFSRTPGSIIRYSCATLLSGLRESEIDFCPVEICQDNGTWSTASLSCAVNECYQRGQPETYKGRRRCTVNGYACELWSNHGFSGQDHRYCRDPGGQKGAPWCHINTPSLPVDWEFCDVPICDEKRLETTRCDGEFVESCNLPDMTVKVDNDCTGIKSLPIYSTDVGSTVHFRCSYIQAKLKSSTGYCPIQVCQKDGLWSEASISCGENECFEAGKSLQYQGHRSCTSSGRNCQSWESQYPHAHDLNATSFPDANMTGSYCRDPDGMRGTPWCFTTDPKIKWEECSIDICNEIELLETQCSFMGEEIGTENISPPDKYQFQTNLWEQALPLSSFLHRNNKHVHVETKSDLPSRSNLHSQYHSVLDEPEFTISFFFSNHLPTVTPSDTQSHESTRNLLSTSFNNQHVSTISGNGHHEEHHLNPTTSVIESNGPSELSDIQNSYQSASSLFTFQNNVPKSASAVIHSYDQQYVLSQPSVNTQSLPSHKIYNSRSQMNHIQIPNFNFESDHTQASSPYPNIDFTRVYSSYSKEVSEISSLHGKSILVQTHSLITAIDQESYYIPYSDISDVGSNIYSPDHLQDTSRINEETRYEISHSTNKNTMAQLVASETKEIVLVSNDRDINFKYNSFGHEYTIDDTYRMLVSPVDTILYAAIKTFQLPSIPSKSVLKKHVSVFPNAKQSAAESFSVESSERSSEFLINVEIFASRSISFRTSLLEFSPSVSENERLITAYLDNTHTLETHWKSVRPVSSEHPGRVLEMTTKESSVSLLQRQIGQTDTLYRSVSLTNLGFSIQPSTQEDLPTHSELISNLKSGNDGKTSDLYDLQPSFISIPSARYAATSPLKTPDSKRYINLSSFIPGESTTNVEMSENSNNKKSPQAADTILHDKNMKSSSSSVTLEVASSIMNYLQNGISDERLTQYSSFPYNNENHIRVPVNDHSMSNFASSKNTRIPSAHTKSISKQCLVDNGGEDVRLDSSVWVFHHTTITFTKLGSLDGTFHGKMETEIACGRQCSRVTACDMYTFNLNSKICSLFSFEKGDVHLDCVNYDELACYRRCFSI